MDSGILNIGSLILGLVAWIVPVISILKKNQKARHLMLAIFSSFTACGMSLLFQLFDTWIIIKKNDWVALLDIYGSLVFITSVLLTVTVILNIPLLFRVKR